ncbi:hypothetical protein D3C76_1823040 [compost metagenome]
MHLRLAAKGDQANLNLRTQATLLGKSRNHFLRRGVECFDLAVLTHAATGVGQDNHG